MYSSEKCLSFNVPLRSIYMHSLPSALQVYEGAIDAKSITKRTRCQLSYFNYHYAPHELLCTQLDNQEFLSLALSVGDASLAILFYS